METNKERNETETAVRIAYIVQELSQSSLNTQLKKTAQAHVLNPEVDLASLKDEVRKALRQSGQEKLLQNAVYKQLAQFPPAEHPHATLEQLKEPLSYIRRAQSNWEKRIVKSLNSMCTELSIPLARKRALSEQKELRSTWNELGTDEPDLSAFRPVYAPKDFLDVLITVKNPQQQQSSNPLHNTWGLLQIPLKVKSLTELQNFYGDLSPSNAQIGVENLSSMTTGFENEAVKFGHKIVNENHCPLAQLYAKQGCPTTLRAQVWSSILGVSTDDIDLLYYDQLKNYVLQHDLLVDNLMYKDVKLTAANDDQYFVFEDNLYQVLFLFSRDTYVLKHFANSSASPAKSYIRGMLGVEDYSVVYPPNGVIPFHGFSMLVVPLCFVFDDPIKLYFNFRELYCCHFHRLHTISSHEQGMLSICVLFETILQSRQPHLFLHLKETGAHPLKIAFKWLMRAFSGYLAADQLLCLWDRILAYGTLELLAVLAAGIFSFRRVNLMETSSYASAEAVLADITTVKVLPILQLFLFSTN
ncbi:TBC1 domain family member 19-like [Anneissia japonica]|uniref:TBC1 domain family member 19-like n=1 Tax=Anneissia japonica TaxID=1529436 RepID=UPI001425A924|nr:TBC1 domain family member 19-like [Anneissia japonica]XP_033116110.1 TBC1 domain family member 19-like [Anneissia japonica]XP_033116111.1 TBC1 domain family member 19-like [Anneissia japonica]